MQSLEGGAGVLVVLAACSFSPSGATGATGADAGALQDSVEAGAGDGTAQQTQGMRPDAALILGLVDLRSAGHFAILGEAGISGISATVTGDLGASPVAATYITGFSLTADPTNQFWRSTQVTGNVYAASDAAPTPAMLLTANDDLQLAITDAAGRAPDVTGLGSGELGGHTLAAGTYAFTGAAHVTTDLTLDGGVTAVWIFQVGGDLTLAANAHVRLTGGALASHVFWQVHGATTLAAMAHLEGVLLAETAFTGAAGVSVHGRVLAKTFANVDGSTIVEPAP